MNLRPEISTVLNSKTVENFPLDNLAHCFGILPQHFCPTGPPAYLVILLIFRVQKMQSSLFNVCYWGEMLKCEVFFNFIIVPYMQYVAGALIKVLCS